MCCFLCCLLSQEDHYGKGKERFKAPRLTRRLQVHSRAHTFAQTRLRPGHAHIGHCRLLRELHWADVKAILTDVIESADFRANLVSDADDVGIIQKRIIQNLYENPIVICDVSAKNPNVMFELGLRLAFDKPTIIVKDDLTDYSFDTGIIEHLDYPRDLRFNKIVAFKEKLKTKITATHKKATEDPSSYTTFLKHFGTFTVAKLDSKEVSRDDYVLQELKDLRRMLVRREQAPEPASPSQVRWTLADVITLRNALREAAEQLLIKPDMSEERVRRYLPMLQQQVRCRVSGNLSNDKAFDTYFAAAVADFFER